jgi:predicted AAA+ superfamily ATPase
MQNYYGDPMVEYRPRLVDHLVKEALSTFGAVIIEGPRAVGKTSTGSEVCASVVRLDESPDVAALAETSPGTILAGPTPRLIDEWQLAPSLWNAVRHEVDRRGSPGQFVMTGSATPIDDITRHSGAGRFRRVTLRPMTLAESGESTRAVRFAALFDGDHVGGIGGPTVEEYARLVARGGWPALVAQPDRSPLQFLSAYLDDIARVDLPGAEVRVDPLRMRALLRAVARNVATEATAVMLATEAAIMDDQHPASPSAQSVRKYLDALTRVFVIEEQQAWAPNLRSKVRLRVRPKWHFVDPSLAVAALGAEPQRLLDDLNTFGLLFESLAIRDLRAYAQTMDGTVYHYRDSNGLEVDAIVELPDGRWAAFEVKLGGSRNIDAAAANLASLVRKLDARQVERLTSLNVITGGTTSHTRPDGVNVVSLGHLTAE